MHNPAAPLIAAEARIPAGMVCALGVTQIIGYGSLYYSFGILAPGMAQDLGLTLTEVFAVFSGSLFIGGLFAAFIGRLMDHVGAATVMTGGSALSAAILVLGAWSPSVVVFALAIILLEASAGMVQYQAAFATLVETSPKSASRSITYLTLIGGFASTIFWPVSAALAEHLSWREIYLVFAGLNLFLCMPIHGWLMRAGKRGSAAISRDRLPVAGHLPADARRRGVLLVSAAFALLGFSLAAILAHMVPMLEKAGLGAAAAIVAALFGPAQVMSRLFNMVFGARLPPPALAILSTVLIVAAVLTLLASGGSLAGAVVFAIGLGLGSGINSIAQGSLPLYLFGSEGYGTVTGKMTAARLTLSAAAPFLFAAAMQQVGIGFALSVAALVGCLALVAFGAVALQARRHTQLP